MGSYVAACACCTGTSACVFDSAACAGCAHSPYSWRVDTAAFDALWFAEAGTGYFGGGVPLVKFLLTPLLLWYDGCVWEGRDDRFAEDNCAFLRVASKTTLTLGTYYDGDTSAVGASPTALESGEPETATFTLAGTWSCLGPNRFYLASATHQLQYSDGAGGFVVFPVGNATDGPFLTLLAGCDTGCGLTDAAGNPCTLMKGKLTATVESDCPDLDGRSVPLELMTGAAGPSGAPYYWIGAVALTCCEGNAYLVIAMDCNVLAGYLATGFGDTFNPCFLSGGNACGSFAANMADATVTCGGGFFATFGPMTLAMPAALCVNPGAPVCDCYYLFEPCTTTAGEEGNDPPYVINGGQVTVHVG